MQSPAAAAAVLAADPSYNALLHTTCIPTLLSAGHANNALPQRADANPDEIIGPDRQRDEGRLQQEQRP